MRNNIFLSMELGLFGNLSANGFNCSTTLFGVIESNFRQQRSNITSDAKLYPIEGRQNGNDLIPSIDKYLLLWVLGGILFLPTAIEAVLDLDSTLITDPTSLLKTYYNSLYDTSSSIATSITTLTTLVTTQYNDLVTGLITIMTTLTTIINTMITISNSITTINTQITTITIGCQSNCGEVRLQDGSTGYEGRIEVRLDGGPWGLVCDDYFDINDGHVFCKMLGYANGAETVYIQSHFGHGNLDFHLDDLDCTGQELTFLDCPFVPGTTGAAGWGSHNCGSSEATGVRCYPNRKK